MTTVKTRKKLIEVALPLEAINKESSREKSIRHGHPSTMHLYWARRPLATARAVIFAQMVDDPSSCPELFPTAKQQEKERQRLFRLIEKLVIWENTTDLALMDSAKGEIMNSWRRACTDNADHPDAARLFDRNKPPGFHDPFAGGGALPFEAQRLGLDSYASDLNPVAVLINKAMIEIPPKFAGKPPINSKGTASLSLGEWGGAKGLANDVAYYGQVMNDWAFAEIGKFYPEVKITDSTISARPELRSLKGQTIKVIAYLHTRTLKCPNPGCGCEMPLLSSFCLSVKKGRESFLQPVKTPEGKISFEVTSERPTAVKDVESGYKRGMSGIFECYACGSVTTRNYTAEEGKAGRIRSMPTAVVCDGPEGRAYLSLDCLSAVGELPAVDTTGLTFTLAANPRDVWCRNFGLNAPVDLFNPRQLVAMTTFSALVARAREQVKADAIKAGFLDDGIALEAGGRGATAYAQAVGLYLGFGVDRAADYWSSLCCWNIPREQIRNVFGRQAIPMVWDYVETNPFSESSGNWLAMVDWVWKAIEKAPATNLGLAIQAPAQLQELSNLKVVSTDPPYYDNIGYADLSDFFYAWLRKTQLESFPTLLGTLAVPKTEELVALAYRHGGKDKAEEFFLDGMTLAMAQLAQRPHPSYPVTIYYAFKQSEKDADHGTSSTGWETFLNAVIEAGFSITGTWPMRTERSTRMVAKDTNALASSIVLVCRPKLPSAVTVTRRDFIVALKAELPSALTLLQAENVAPVDLAQASIGPGMAIYSRYAKVLDASGKQLEVKEALQLINQVLDEQLSEAESNLDVDTRWAVVWFDQHGFSKADYGTAELLARAKDTSVDGLALAGVVEKGAGMVRLIPPDELPSSWDPLTDSRLTVWEMVHHLIRVLKVSEQSAAAILAKLGDKAEAARELSYRLYNLCDRKKRHDLALAYNNLVQIWPDLLTLSHNTTVVRPGELELDA